MIVKAWYCSTCHKATTNLTPNDDAKPEHISYRGVDLGCCPGKMELVLEKEVGELGMSEEEFKVTLQAILEDRG